MLLIFPFTVSKTEYSIYIGLDDGGIDRLRVYDPGEIPLAKLPVKWRDYKLKDVIIGYYNQEDYDAILPLIKADNPRAALQYLTRGWQFRPEMGDYDGPLLGIRAEPGETKH